MASFTISRSRCAPILAKVETTYGTDSAPAGNTDDVLAHDSFTPVGVDVRMVNPGTAHGTSLTQRQDIPTRRLARISFKFPMIGSGSAGSIAVNGFRGGDALLQSARMKRLTVATTSLTYSPQAFKSEDSVTIWAEMDGVLHKLTGVYGNVTFSGNAQGFVECRYEGVGEYAVPTAASISSWTGGSLTGEAFVGATTTYTGSGSAVDPVFDSFTFATNNVISEVDDADDANGMLRLLITDAAPTLQTVIALDADATGTPPYPALYDDLVDPTTQSVSIAWGTTPNLITMAFPEAQLTNVTPSSKNGYNIVTLDHKLTHTTANSEFSIAIT